MIKLRPFQRDFIEKAQSDKYDICALSVARGNGKSFLSAQLLLPYLQPDSPVFSPNKELGLVAGSIKQARIVYRFLREELGEDEYKFSDAANRLGITLSANLGETRNEQRIRVGRRQRNRGC